MILILGVTASGKGRLAFELARQIDAEIISIDSMKVYKRMDIGTAKPPMHAREKVKYHLIDVVEPGESFNVAAFLDQANAAVEQIKARGKSVIAVGGTALYIKALLYGLFEGPGSDRHIRHQLTARAETEGLEKLHRELMQIDPAAAERIHRNDARRIIRALEVHQLTGRPISSFQKQWLDQTDDADKWTIVGLRRDRADASGRINKRVGRMINEGLVEEVRSLLAEDTPLSEQARCAIGYAEIIDHIAGNLTLEEATEKIKINTRRLAKSQRTWFKTFRSVNWLDIEADEPPERTLERTVNLLSKGRTD